MSVLYHRKITNQFINDFNILHVVHTTLYIKY